MQLNTRLTRLMHWLVAASAVAVLAADSVTVAEPPSGWWINDSTAALNASNDLLINLTGHSGTLPAIGTIAVNRVFA